MQTFIGLWLIDEDKMATNLQTFLYASYYNKSIDILIKILLNFFC